MDDTQIARKGQTCPTQEAALDYHRRGWSLVPIAPGTKLPPRGLRWKRYQTERADAATLKRWFGQGKHGSLAVILGAVSGGLVCRDFDTKESYQKWAQTHPELARTLPTVATHRGRHVYFQSDFDGCEHLEDGELRSTGHYCLLPPSPHPKGSTYKWVVPLPDGALPVVEDVVAAGFLPGDSPYRVYGVYRAYGATEGYGAISGGGGAASPTTLDFDEIDVDEDTKRLIAATLESELPPSVGTRDNHTLSLARALKAVPALYSAEAGDLKPLVRYWHKLGVERGVIGTESFDVAWAAFLRVWPKIKFPKGADPMKMIVERADNSPLPPAADNYDSAAVKRLVAICKALQDVAGDRPFFIACRVAGELIGVHFTTAADFLNMLCHDKPPVLQLVKPGERAKRRANRYRYVAE